MASLGIHEVNCSFAGLAETAVFAC